MNGYAQSDYIYTREGRPVLNRRELIFNCLRSIHADRSNAAALAVCECMVDKIDWKFTNRQYKKYTKSGSINIQALIAEDSIIEKEVQECFTNSGRTRLLQAQGFGNDFISNCIKNIQKSTQLNLDSGKLRKFCRCQLELIKTKQLTDAELESLSNPNSLLFYEVMYKCGDPFAGKEQVERGWNENIKSDIQGPSSDTISILTLHGMTYVKLKTGSLVRVWLFDTGATDLLINNKMEQALKKENVITTNNYLGTGEYEMANGTIDTCRKYLVNDIQIGRYHVNHVIVAVSDKAKKIIAGKGLLNKFSNWSLNNKNNTLVLNK